MIAKDSEQLRKGIEFEGFVKKMFQDPHFEILVQSDEMGTKVPDFYIKEKERGFKFWVEAKYRGRLVAGMIDVFEKNRDRLVVLKMFQQMVLPETVFLIIGLGGQSSDPDELFCLPVMEMDYPSRYRDKFNGKEIDRCPFTRYENGLLVQ
jgi:hypothetical protein